ncbi:MAG: RNA 2'-phosphotransferase [Desulfohalobiaceae bacterium]
MDSKRLIHISKYLSKHLRHRPDRLALELFPGGWVPVDELLAALGKNNFPVTRRELEQVVAENDKQRFSLDQSGEMIRANQGHSVEVDLGLEPVPPPERLYHGTARQNLAPILQAGLARMGRHHVHLCRTPEEARKIGARRGRPVVLEIDAAGMERKGYRFFVSDNDVWLTEEVPPRLLRPLEPGGSPD